VNVDHGTIPSKAMEPLRDSQATILLNKRRLRTAFRIRGVTVLDQQDAEKRRNNVIAPTSSVGAKQSEP